MKTKSIVRDILLALLVLVLINGFEYLRDNRLPNFKKQAEFCVYPSMTSEDVLAVIDSLAGVRKEYSLKRCFRKKKVGEYLKPGHYTVLPSNSSAYIARMLNNGWQTPVKVTLSGNLRIKSNIAAKISSQLLIDSASVHAALENDSLLSEYGFCSRDVFSLLFPATYEMYWTADMKDFLNKQKQALDAFWTAENKALASDLGLSEKQVSVLASIVCGETNITSEMPLIAGVYLNRLAIGMPMQADPTIAFCYDYRLGRILKEHLSVDSPYNTYTHKGLPPGPICVPTADALRAVLNPDYGSNTRGNGNLYFCASPDFSGRHVFARTLSEHNGNAASFRRALDRRMKSKGGN